jgi:hypothetical protein
VYGHRRCLPCQLLPAAENLEGLREESRSAAGEPTKATARERDRSQSELCPGSDGSRGSRRRTSAKAPGSRDSPQNGTIFSTFRASRLLKGRPSLQEPESVTTTGVASGAPGAFQSAASSSPGITSRATGIPWRLAFREARIVSVTWAAGHVGWLADQTRTRWPDSIGFGDPYPPDQTEGIVGTTSMAEEFRDSSSIVASFPERTGRAVT